jgi:hypothetical protein
MLPISQKIFEDTIKHFRNSGCVPLGSAKPAVAFGGARVIFSNSVKTYYRNNRGVKYERNEMGPDNKAQ